VFFLLAYTFKGFEEDLGQVLFWKINSYWASFPGIDFTAQILKIFAQCWGSGSCSGSFPFPIDVLSGLK
jgi:hypothetical protein